MHDPKVKAIGKIIAAQPGFAEWLSGGQICEMQTSEAALRHIVTGALHVTWSVTNEHAKNGKVSDADVTWIDTVTGITGFGKAMESVGWVKEDGTDLIFPKFDENNTSSAERMRRHRQRHKASRVTSQERHSDASQSATVTSHVTLEKRREEKSKGLSKDSPRAVPDIGDFVSAWNNTPGVRTIRSLGKRAKSVATRMADPEWDWRGALAKFPLRCFASDPGGFVPDLEFFLRPDTVTKILEGKYDWEKRNGSQRNLAIGAGQTFDPAAAERDPNYGKM